MKKYIFVVILQFSCCLYLFSQKLDTLPGRVKVLFSENKVRAQTIQRLLEECVLYYENIKPAYKFNITTKLLNKRDWEQLLYKMPYGMPHYRGGFIIIPSDKKTAGELLMGKPDLSPDSVLSPLDAIAVHELGHYYLMTLIKADTASRWANEFMAQYFATAFFIETNKFGLPPGEVEPYMPTYHTLKDFEEVYLKMDPFNYGWYQGQFIKLAYMLYPKLKMQLMEDYIGKNPGVPLLTILKRVAESETNTWLQDMH